MMTSIAIQEIHDTLREPSWAQVARMIKHDTEDSCSCQQQNNSTDWQAMWRQRGVRLMKIADELEEVTRQRDMLARRCAEQANHIAGLISLQAEEAAEADPIHNAIAAMQKAGLP